MHRQIPSKRSKMTTYTTFLTSSTRTGWRKLILMSVAKAKSCQYQKVETYNIPNNCVASPWRTQEKKYVVASYVGVELNTSFDPLQEWDAKREVLF